jgi:uncharacterized membrane protein
MASRNFWRGFTAGAVSGAAAGAASLIAWKLVGRVRNGRILRFEKSVQIGRPVGEVYEAWTRLDQLPRFVDFIESVEPRGERSHWTVNIGGRRIEWDAEITQRMPNQAIGWKSLNGPKHTGRVDFSPLGSDTLIHVTMNYCPPAQLGRLFSPLTNPIEHYIDEAFRGFKAALEGKGQDTASSGRLPMSGVTGMPAANQQRATGTYGQTMQQSDLDRHTQTGRFGGPESAVEYTRPPEAKS